MSHATPLAEVHRAAGAQMGVFFGCELPASFGDFDVEYRAARESVALLDTNFRVFLELSGPDRERFLNAIATSEIKGLNPGRGSVGLLLNPQGHILAEIETYVLADRFLMLTHATAGDRAARWLEKYIIMDDVALTDATPRMTSLALEGPRAPELVKAACGLELGTMPAASHCETQIGTTACRIIRRSHFGSTGAELIVAPASLPGLWQTLLDEVRRCGGAPVGFAVWNSLRLEAGIPWFGYDFDDKYIPHEAALEGSHISFTKGCYTGQEIVERVRSRGHVNRKRVGLQFDHAKAPPTATKLLVDGKEVGHVTSAAFSPTRGRAIGMGYLRHEQTAPGSRVQCESGTAEVIELPLEM